MKRMLVGLVALAALGAVAQEQAVQSGVPALLEAVNGKQARVFLQQLEEGKLAFQAYKSDKDISVETAKIKSLTFFPKYDADAVAAAFNAGDYPAVIATLAPLLEPYWDYMVVENNLRDAFCMLMDAYRESGEWAPVRKAAGLLLATGDPDLVQRGQVNSALAALAAADVQTAEKIRSEVASEAAGLYLQACIERAQGDPKQAIRTVAAIISEHGNDVEWLAPSELLCAHLYLDMAGADNAVITTNSALNTARQVKNMYAGTRVAADAQKLWDELGGAELEAAAAAEKAARAVAEQAAKEKREAEEKARLEAAAAAAAATNVNVSATAEMESE